MKDQDHLEALKAMRRHERQQAKMWLRLSLRDEDRMRSDSYAFCHDECIKKVKTLNWAIRNLRQKLNLK